jgi:hypothetical protein
MFVVFGCLPLLVSAATFVVWREMNTKLRTPSKTQTNQKYTSLWGNTSGLALKITEAR